MVATSSKERFVGLFEGQASLDIELASGRFSGVLSCAFEEIEEEFRAHGNSEELAGLFEIWGQKILFWWDYNIRNGNVRIQSDGDPDDGGWTALLDREEEQGAARVRIFNSSWDPIKIEAKVDEEDLRSDEWEIRFNGDWMESIKRTQYSSDPEHKRSRITDEHMISCTKPSFRTKPAPQTP